MEQTECVIAIGLDLDICHDLEQLMRWEVIATPHMADGIRHLEQLDALVILLNINACRSPRQDVTYLLSETPITTRIITLSATADRDFEAQLSMLGVQSLTLPVSAVELRSYCQ